MCKRKKGNLYGFAYRVRVPKNCRLNAQIMSKTGSLSHFEFLWCMYMNFLIQFAWKKRDNRDKQVHARNFGHSTKI